jgi:site-specific DNA recombinase
MKGNQEKEKNITNENSVETQGTDEFRKMMKECEAGKIDLIMAKSYIRFLESTEERTEVLDRLRQLDIEVFSQKENSNTQLVKSERVLQQE